MQRPNLPRFSESGNPATFYARNRGAHLSGAGADEAMARTRQDYRDSREKLSKKYGVDWLRRKTAMQYRVYTPDTNPHTVPANTTNVAIIRIDRAGHFEAHSIVAYVNDGVNEQVRGDFFTYRITDPRTGRDLMNGPMHMLTATGSGTFPFHLPDTKFFTASSVIQVEFTNLTAGSIDIDFQVHGRELRYKSFKNLTDVDDFERLSRPEQEFMIATQKRFVEPYMFTTDTNPFTIAAGVGTGQSQQRIEIPGSFDFEWFGTAVHSEAEFTWEVRGGPNDNRVFHQPLGSVGSTGTGERPFWLPETFLLPANSELLLDFTNRSANTNEVYLTLIGRNWYDREQMNLTGGPELFYDRYLGM